MPRKTKFTEIHPERCSVYGLYDRRVLPASFFYVGSTKHSIGRRLQGHIDAVRYKTTPNRHLINTFNRIGADNIAIAVIESVPSSERFEREYFWINTLLKQGSRLVNIRTTADVSQYGYNQILPVEECELLAGFYAHYAEHLNGTCSLKAQLLFAQSEKFKTEWALSRKARLVGAIRACRLFAKREASSATAA